MRILIASQNYDLTTSGAGVFTVRLAEGLVERGHMVRVLKPSDRIYAYQTEQNGVQVQNLRAVPLVPFFRDVFVTTFPSRQIQETLGEFRPEIVHVQDHYPLSRSALRQAKHLNIPVVGTNNFLPENILDPIHVVAPLRSILEGIIWRTVTSGFDGAAIVTTPTKTASEIMRKHDFSMPVKAISCGVDLNQFYPNPAIERGVLRERYGMDPKCVLILYVGRLDAEKRLDVMIRALHLIDRKDIQIGIVGHGREFTSLKKLVEQLGLEDQVIFTGFVPGGDLPGLLRSADLFAMPSEAETQSIATLEAMASGLPVIAADARALPELVEQGINGYLFRKGDAADAASCIQTLLSRRRNWPAMGKASLEMVKSHRIENTIQEFETLYNYVYRSISPRRDFHQEKQEGSTFKEYTEM